MHIETEELKKKVSESGYTGKTFAATIGMDESTYYRKLKNSGEKFTLREVYSMASALPLTPAKAKEIFLADNSHKRELIDDQPADEDRPA